MKSKNVYQNQEYVPAVDNSRQDGNDSHGSDEAGVCGSGVLSHSSQESEEWQEGELNDDDEEQSQILIVLVKDEPQEAGEHANASDEGENTSTDEIGKRKTCRYSGAVRSNCCGDVCQRLLEGEENNNISVFNLVSYNNLCGPILPER